MFEDTCNFTALNDVKIMMIFVIIMKLLRTFPTL